MQRFSSFDLQRNVAKVQEAALKEPVSVSYHGRDRLVILPIDEFERLKRRDKQVISMQDLPDEFLAALQEPFENAEQAALDHLLDD
ncbi:MAG: type II toxin-antitoxin system Phd/YefM family antitoxin [Rhodospirillales bacterium]|nr:MAG: type II toxin-antitoxin system Phd/YefM family antitoxin [Rhodospirillales bacterium]